MIQDGPTNLEEPILGALPRRQSLSQAVADELQQLIARQKMAAGQRLPGERELAAQLKVSRSVVREAIRLLEGLRIVAVEHGRGVFLLERQSVPLTDLSQVESQARLRLLRQATQVRQLVDTEACRLAAMNATASNIERILDYLHLAEQEPLLSQRKYQLDLTFEQLIGDATSNEYLIAAQRLAHQMFIGAWQSSGFIPRPAAKRNLQHWEIFDALKSRDSELAARLMHEHVTLEPIEQDV